MSGTKEGARKGAEKAEADRRERLARAEEANRRTDGPGSQAWAEKHGLK